MTIREAIAHYELGKSLCGTGFLNREELERRFAAVVPTLREEMGWPREAALDENPKFDFDFEVELPPKTAALVEEIIAWIQRPDTSPP